MTKTVAVCGDYTDPSLHEISFKRGAPISMTDARIDALNILDTLSGALPDATLKCLSLLIDQYLYDHSGSTFAQYAYRKCLEWKSTSDELRKIHTTASMIKPITNQIDHSLSEEDQALYDAIRQELESQNNR